MAKNVRVQTTINVSESVLETIDELGRISGVSRSKLIDLAARHFCSWAQQLSGEHLRILAETMITEQTSGYVRKVTPDEIAQRKVKTAQEAIAASEAAIARAMNIPVDTVRRAKR